jgi:MYXO-CTERM domain-containing protein
VAVETKAQAPNRLQIRYNNFHPSIVTVNCPDPKRWRWGRPPNTYRGLRKIWLADDLTRKSRTQIKPAEVVLTPIKELGLTGKVALPNPDGGLDGGTGGGSSKGCGCALPGTDRTPPTAWLALVAVLWSTARRIRSVRRGR